MLIVDVNEQVHTFLLSLVLGAVICLVYDFLRAMHLVFLKGFFEVLITDVLFWVFFSFVTFFYLLIYCKGVVRGYVICGIFLGFVAIRLTISRFILFVFRLGVKFVMSILHLVADKFRLILLSLYKYFKKVADTVKKVLQMIIKVMYNLLKSRCSCVKKGKGESNGSRN